MANPNGSGVQPTARDLREVSLKYRNATFDRPGHTATDAERIALVNAAIDELKSSQLQQAVTASNEDTNTVERISPEPAANAQKTEAPPKPLPSVALAADKGTVQSETPTAPESPTAAKTSQVIAPANAEDAQAAQGRKAKADLRNGNEPGEASVSAADRRVRKPGWSDEGRMWVASEMAKSAEEMRIKRMGASIASQPGKPAETPTKPTTRDADAGKESPPKSKGKQGECGEKSMVAPTAEGE